MGDLISRQAAIDAIDKYSVWVTYTQGDSQKDEAEFVENIIKQTKKAIQSMLIEDLPSAQPDVPDINVGDINKFIDELEEIFAGQRERHVDDSVCGLCEYDGAYIGQSGDWCNECPGFDRDDCFKLSDKCRKEWIDTIANSLPSTQPKIIHCKDCAHYGGYGYCHEVDGLWHDGDYCSRAERRKK